MRDFLKSFCVTIEVTLALGHWDVHSFALQGHSRLLLWSEEAMGMWLVEKRSGCMDPLKKKLLMSSTLYIKESVRRKWLPQCQTERYIQRCVPFDRQIGLGLGDLCVLRGGGRQFLQRSQLKMRNGFAQQQSSFYSFGRILSQWSFVLAEAIGKYQHFEFQNTNGYLVNV